MIKVVSFYKDIELKKEKTTKLKARNAFNYKECQQKLYQTLEKFSKGNCEFIASTDNFTDIGNYPRIERNDLDGKLLMESVAIANSNFIKKEKGKIILLGADHLFCGNPDILFEDEFDLAFLIDNNFDEKFQTNINNTIVIINSTDNNFKKIKKFFEKRLQICMSLPLAERRWYADQKSLSILLEEKNIVTEYHRTKNIYYDFDGLKIKLIPWGNKYLKVVNSQGEYKKDIDDVIIDFCGKDTIKQHMHAIYEKIMTEN